MEPTLKSAGLITDIRPLLLDVPTETAVKVPMGTMQRKHLFMLVETSTGFLGLGETWGNFPAWGPTDRLDLLRHVVRPLLCGETLDDPRRLYAMMEARLRPIGNQWGALGPTHQIRAGVDIALWDAFARAQGQPLRRVLAGNEAVDTVEVYGSGIGPAPVLPLIEQAKRNGHMRFKLRLVTGEQDERRRLRDARDAVGNAPLMADASQSWTLERLHAMEPDLRRARLDWLEEPFLVDDEAPYTRARALDYMPPLALGENAYGVTGAQRMIEVFDAQVLQPDITKTGGISEGFPIGQAVVAAGRRLCFHIFGGPVGQLATAQLCAALPGCDWMEVDADLPPTFETMLGAPLTFEQGVMRLPPGPGIGIELDESAVARWRVELPGW